MEILEKTIVIVLVVCPLVTFLWNFMSTQQ